MRQININREFQEAMNQREQFVLEHAIAASLMIKAGKQPTYTGLKCIREIEIKWGQFVAYKNIMEEEIV